MTSKRFYYTLVIFGLLGLILLFSGCEDVTIQPMDNDKPDVFLNLITDDEVYVVTDEDSVPDIEVTWDYWDEESRYFPFVGTAADESGIKYMKLELHPSYTFNHGSITPHIWAPSIIEERDFGSAEVGDTVNYSATLQYVFRDVTIYNMINDYWTSYCNEQPCKYNNSKKFKKISSFKK